MSAPGAHGGVSPQQARALARDRRCELRRRARRIRRSVSVLALALFSAAFLAIYVQLASGHDPALAAASRRLASTSVQTDKAASATEPSSGASSSGSSDSSGSSSSSGETEESSGASTGTSGTSGSSSGTEQGSEASSGSSGTAGSSSSSSESGAASAVTTSQS